MAYAGNRAYRAGGINTEDIREERAARRGGGNDYAAAYFANAARNEVDPINLAMKMLGMQEDREQREQEAAYRDREAEALERYRQGGLDIQEAQERRLAETLVEGKRSDAEKEATRQRELGEERAHRTEREKIADTAAAATLAKQQKDEAVDALDKMVARGVIKPEEAAARYEQLDPEQAAIAKGIKAQSEEKAFKTGLEQYRKLSPKDRARATAAGIGGSEEVLQRIKDAVQGYTYEPGGPSAMPGEIGTWKPQLEPTVSEAPPPRVGYGQSAVEAPAYSYATRAPQTVPAVGGITEPVTVPTRPEPEPYPTLTTEDYQRAGIETPEATQARYDADPRYMTVEQELLKKAMDWWNSMQESTAQPEFSYDAYGPSAIPGKIQRPSWRHNRPSIIPPIRQEPVDIRGLLGNQQPGSLR